MQISDVSSFGYTGYAQNMDNSAQNGTENNSTNSVDKSAKSAQSNDKKSSDEQKGVKNQTELSQDEQRVVNELQATDTHVRAHEAAHMAAGGGLTSPASFSYEKGPDNKMYAVAGEVGISTGEGNSPQETLAKAQQIRRAALAPSDPSPQDLKVAAKAASMEMSARMQIMQEKLAEGEANAKKAQANSSMSGANGAQNSSNVNEQVAQNNAQSVIKNGVDLSAIIG